MIRKLYKLISWDYGTNSGLATDGTQFDGEPITFVVQAADLPEKYNGHLLLNEVFSADENLRHELSEIIIERGPRSEAPSDTYSNPDPAGSVDIYKGTFVPSVTASQESVEPDSVISSLAHRVSDLEKRVGTLEASRAHKAMEEIEQFGNTHEPK